MTYRSGGKTFIIEPLGPPYFPIEAFLSADTPWLGPRDGLVIVFSFVGLRI